MTCRRAMHDQHRQSGNAQQDANAMDHAAGEFVAETVARKRHLACCGHATTPRTKSARYLFEAVLPTHAVHASVWPLRLSSRLDPLTQASHTDFSVCSRVKLDAAARRLY